MLENFNLDLYISFNINTNSYIINKLLNDKILKIDD